jgi:hypothetical protein
VLTLRKAASDGDSDPHRRPRTNRRATYPRVEGGDVAD